MTRFWNGAASADVPRLLATLLAAGLCLTGLRRPTLRVAVLACLAYDLRLAVQFKYPSIEPAFHNEPASVAAAKRLCDPDPPRLAVLWSRNQTRKVDLNTDGWRLSMDPYRRIGECLYYERGPLFDVGLVPDVGQLPLQPTRLAEFRSVTPDPFRSARLFGIPLVMSPVPTGEEHIVYRGVGGVLERVPEAAPYALFVNVMERLPASEVLARVSAADFDPAKDVVLEGGATSKAPIRVERASAHWEGPNRLILEVDAPTDGVVLVHEMFDAGWKATVDGIAVVIERGNWLFMAVPVNAGQRHIEFIYAPTSARVGRWISAAAFFLWLGVMIRRLGCGSGQAFDRQPPGPWIVVAVFFAVFAVSAPLLYSHWVDAFPTVLDQR